ncbi:Tudor and KH domain-containing protein [Blattella germanica]|nr:Tudor and KH domain-containing protein [Blattella germanica]
MNAKTVVPIVIGLSLTSVSAAYLLYLYFKKDEDFMDSSLQRITTSRQVAIEVKIPRDCLGVVIGRGGGSIKSIQEKTHTKINFKDQFDNEQQHRVCVIRGTPEAAQLAESLIHDIILNQPLIETYEMFVPQNACGRIIGRNGDTIRSISSTSNAKITIENSTTREPNTTRRVTIKGSVDQIELAKNLIEEKVIEDAEMRGKIHDVIEKRSPRKKLGPQYLMSAEAVDEQNRRHNTERLLSSGNDYLELYVSAVANPSCFWVQMIGPRAVELDHLVEDMSEYYRQDVNRELHHIKDISVEQLVAAPFSHDDKWYRARVTGVNLDDYDIEDSDVELYYLDYGDSDSRKKREVFSLRADFLKLRYQAIECSLAKVKPHGDSWTNGATELFEDLSHVAQWRVLMARVDTYKERERGDREGSPIPAVELWDTSGAQDIYVADELVKQGFAEWDKSPDNKQTTTQTATGGKVDDIGGRDFAAGVKSSTFGGTNTFTEKGDDNDDDNNEFEMG